MAKVQELEQKENSRQVMEEQGSKQAAELGHALHLIQMAALRAKTQMADEVVRQAKGMEEIRQVIREEINAEG